MLLSLILSSFLTFVELNCENLFDTRHDVGKEDSEFLIGGARHWTEQKYWLKLNRIGQEILSCSDDLPALVALCEVENDSVLRDLTRRSLLRGAGYEYLMTQSPDVRGLDVALLYRPAKFRPICYEEITVPLVGEMRPTRDVLYVKGETVRGDTLHIYVLHAPSRYGGEQVSRPYRLQVMKVLETSLPSMPAHVIVTGDFNDYDKSASLRELERVGLVNVSKHARGGNGARGTYRYQGEWRSLDHFLVTPSMLPKIDSVYINDMPFLLEEESKYGGKRPKRTFQGMRYRKGFSDHLPLVLRLKL